MAGVFGFSILGMSQLKKKLDGMLEHSPEAMNKSAMAGALVFERLEKRFVRGRHDPLEGVSYTPGGEHVSPNVISGNLMGSIHSHALGMGTAEVGPAVPYAAYVEYGTGERSDWPGGGKSGLPGSPPYPFVRPAYYEGLEPAKEAAAVVMRREFGW